MSREKVERVEGTEPVVEGGRPSAEPYRREAPRRGVIPRALWAVGGFVCFGLAMLGALLPVIPTVPFLLAAAFFFARSSQRVNAWFKSTRLYHTVLEGYVRKRTMTPKAKLSVLLPVTLLLSLSFLLMGDVPIGRVVVALVWIGHVIYFGFVVGTERD